MVQKPVSPKPLLTLLEQAWSLDPERYQAEWRPYLQDKTLPVYQAKALDELKNLNKLLPHSVTRHARFAYQDIGIKTLLKAIHSGLLDDVSLLDVRQCNLNSMIVAAISERTAIERIEHLNLSHNKVSGRGITPLFNAPHLQSLKVLYLNATNVDLRFAEALVESNHITLDHLSIAGINCSNQFLGHFNQLKHIPQTIDLSNNQLNQESARYSQHWRWLREVKTLHIKNNPITVEGLGFILSALQNVQVLDIHHINPMTGRQHGLVMAEHLCEATHLEHLQALLCTHNALGDQGLRRLIESPLLHHLEYLDLSHNRLTEQGIACLRNIQNPSLYIDLMGNDCQTIGYQNGEFEYRLI